MKVIIKNINTGRKTILDGICHYPVEEEKGDWEEMKMKLLKDRINFLNRELRKAVKELSKLENKRPYGLSKGDVKINKGFDKPLFK